MKKTFLSMMLVCLGIMACALMAACGSQKKSEEAEAAPQSAQPKVLVLYYSQTGATKAVAEEIQKQLGADMEEIVVEDPYDGDFMATVLRCNEEQAEGVYPTIKPIQSNLGEYDLIFLGYPVWFGTYARPISSLLRAQSFDGMKVVTFCTFGSGGLETSTKALKDAMEGAEVTEGYGVRNARIAHASEELNRFLIEGGYKEGEIEPLPAFMEHHPVTPEEKAIFHEACDDYQFPLGTPVDVAVRETSTSTDYEFTANTGKDKTTVVVTVSKAEGSKPEFTKAVR